MSYNGSGTFVINTAGQPVVSGTVISSTAFNALTADLATGLSTAITKDGQTTPTANIPMGNNKITGLAVGTAATDAANLSQVQSTTAKLINSISGTDTITGTMSPTLGAYATGQMFYFIAAGDNTGAVTLNIDSLGAKAVTRDGSVALAAGDIKSGEVVVVVYDGTRFQVVSQINSSGNATFANVSITSALNVGGVATFSAGTAAAPSITTSGDTNTGIFFPAADTIAFAEGGVEAARFDSSGNLGIGTSSPVTKLNVVDSTTNSYVAAFRGVGGTNLVALGTTSGGASIAGFTAGFAAATDLIINPNGGNLGLGVTPSAWASSWKVFQSQGGFVGSNATSGYFISNNSYSDGTNWRRVSAEAASQYLQSAGAHSWYTAGSSTAGSTITFTQAMTLDASGNLALGTTSSLSSLYRFTLVGGRVNFASASDGLNLYLQYNNSTNGVFLGSPAASTFAINTFDGTNVTERARITSGGYWKASNDGTYNAGGAGADHELRQSAADRTLLITNTNNSGPVGVLIYYSAASPNGTGNIFLKCEDNTTSRAEIRSNGGLANYSANNVNLASDERLKKDISPLNTAWDKVKNIEVVNYRYKDCNEGDPLLYGVIAQQVQPIVPELVVVTREATETDPEYYGIREQPMYWLAIKALQEAMTKIETLEAKVAALEAK